MPTTFSSLALILHTFFNVLAGASRILFRERLGLRAMRTCSELILAFSAVSVILQPFVAKALSILEKARLQFRIQ
jgi:hypothetical protein